SVRIISTSLIGAPRTVGLLSPMVVISTGLRDRLPAELAKRVTRHEIDHALWFDPLVHAVVRIIRASLWISPGLWLLERSIRREREAAADRSALEWKGNPNHADRAAEYSTALVALSRKGHEPLATGFGSVRFIEYRIRRAFSPVRRVSLYRAAVVIGALGLTAILITASDHRPDPEAKVRADDGRIVA